MRKFLLLFCAVGFLSFNVKSQTAVFFENFDQPSGADSVVLGSIGAPPLPWDTASNLFRSSGHSFHLKPSRANPSPANTEVWFQTPAFSTIGNPYVFLTFTHIAKLNFLNSAKLFISTDGGTIWTVIDDSYYKGSSVGIGGYVGAEQFNESTYFGQGDPWAFQSNTTPTNAWWVTEQFDLTGAASNDAVSPFVGYPDVRIRFTGTLNSLPPLSTTFYDGWYIDDIKVTAAPCELDPPKLNFNYTTFPCIQNQPENGLVANVNNLYPIGVQVTDAGGYNTGVDSVTLFYSINKAPFVSTKMNLQTAPEFRQNIPVPNVGDTVRWYVVAEDIGCPLINLNNSARLPDLLYNTQSSFDPAIYQGFYTFWVDSALPAKCGSPYCGAYPFVQQTFPYVIDFEDSKWGNVGPVRGVPVGQPHYFNNNPTTSSYGWTIGSGTTPSSPFTGPLNDHTTGTSGGNYLFFEGDGGTADVKFITPCINLANGPSCLSLEFYYHMYGADIDRLSIDIDTGTGSNTVGFVKFELEIDDEQQISQSDPWQRAVLSLNDYIGQIIRVRIRGYRKSGTGTNYADIAIDDFRIFEPDTLDMVVVSNNFPKDGFCDYTNEPVEITVLNNGCNDVTNAVVAYSVNGGPPVLGTITQTLSLGDTFTFTFPTPVTFSTFGNYQIKTWVNLPGDQNLTNDTALGQAINYVQPITSFPFFEDFENGTLGTQNLGNSWFVFTDGVAPAFKWQVGSELTPTRNSGPSNGYHHEGQYLYASSNGTGGTASTYMRTQCIDLSSFVPTDDIALEFFYHGYGNNFNKLEIQVSLAGQDLNTWTTLAPATVTQAQAPQIFELDEWTFKRVDLSAYAGQDIKIRFAVTRQGAGDQTDFAIDKIRIYKMLTNDAGAYTIDKPGGRASQTGPKQPKISIINYGTANVTSVTVHFKTTPLCGTPPPPPIDYSETFTGLNIPSGGSTQVTMNNAGVSFPIGEYKVTAYTSAVNGTNSTTGDSYRFNDTIDRNVIGIGAYDIPFANNFDDCDYEQYGTYPNDGLIQWELGAPPANNPTNIRSARSSPNAWVTNLDGNFLVGTRENLIMPVFDKFDTVFKAELRFYQNIDFGQSVGAASYDVAGSVLYRQQGVFEVLGAGFQAAAIGVNWHGTCIGTPSSALFGGDPAFVVSTTPRPGCVLASGWSNGWVYTMFPLDEFNGDTISKLEMKFEFASSNTMQQANARGGWGIDDFSIYIPPQNSASPVNVTTVSPLPIPGVDQQLRVTIENTGGKELKNCLVNIYVDGLPAPAGTGTLLNATPWLFTNTSSNPWIRSQERTRIAPFVWPANLVTSGSHEVCVITSRPNGVKDNRMADDTLCLFLSVIKEVDMSDIGDIEFCDGFESPTDYKWITKNAKDYSPITSWEEGTPTQFGGAHTGTNVWMTGLDNNYIDGDASALFTPVFLVDSGQVFDIKFWHQMQSEKYHDGGNLEYTLDGGVTWYPIGWSIPGRNKWYNTPFVSALDQIRGGWTDTTGGWVEAYQSISFMQRTKVILRFRFGSDFDINDVGWAIDDFCIKKNDTIAVPDYSIGEGEYELPDEVVIGYLSPNPASESSQLGIFLPEPKVVNIRVVNVIGQTVTTIENRYQEGLTQVELQTAKWKSGIYFVNIEYDGKVVTRKLIISN